MNMHKTPEKKTAEVLFWIMAVSRRCRDRGDYSRTHYLDGANRMIKSKYFSLAELTASDYATRHGIDNTPDEMIVEALSYLVSSTLDHLRRYVKTPIIVTSGYRCSELNSAIGGSDQSQHVLGIGGRYQGGGDDRPRAVRRGL